MEGGVAERRQEWGVEAERARKASRSYPLTMYHRQILIRVNDQNLTLYLRDSLFFARDPPRLSSIPGGSIRLLHAAKFRTRARGAVGVRRFATGTARWSSEAVLYAARSLCRGIGAHCCRVAAWGGALDQALVRSGGRKHAMQRRKQ